MFDFKKYAVLASLSSDPFDYISGEKKLELVDANGITSDSTVLDVGTSFMNLMTVIGAIGLVCSLIFLGYKMILYKNDVRQPQELKEAFIWKCVIAIAMFSFLGLAGVVFSIINGTVAGVG